MNLDLIATCAFGLEGPVKWELTRLGYKPRTLDPGRVGFTGTWQDICRTNLWLRVADRIQIQVADFACENFDQLFDTVRDMDWSHWLPRDANFPVNARSRLSTLTSVPAIQRSTKRAIVDSLRQRYNINELPESGGKFAVETIMLKDRATIVIDTTGASLHKRGYRKLTGQAPIKETLAAAMIDLSVWNGNRPLIDPFCGTGTIPIEAAMIALNQAPGRNRMFAAQDWPQIDAKFWSQCNEEATDSMRRDVTLSITGTDVDEEAIQYARFHAKQAGVEDQIHFQVKPFEELRSKKTYGCVITNPPYGERIEEHRALEPLYQSFPSVLQRLPTWSHFIITSFPRFESVIQKRATRKRKLFNGRIQCNYYQFLGPKPGSDEVQNSREAKVPNPINDGDPSKDQLASLAPPKSRSLPAPPPPVFGGLTAKDHEQAELFASRLSKRARHLRRWPSKRGITCFRLYEKDIPEIPLAVDRYEDCLHLIEFERPHDRDLGRHSSWLELMKKTAAKTLDIPIHQVHLKTRLRQRGRTQHEKQDSSGKRMKVNEGGHTFLVNLEDYVDTGLFLDHRVTRGMVQREAKGRRFLNLFAYTGAFSVYAAAGGATTTCTVDWSNTYLDWAKDNMKANGFDGINHSFIRRSATEFVERLANSSSQTANGNFDLVVVDPPTFSNSKRTELVWDVQRDYAELLNRLRQLLSQEAIVYFSTNFRKFKFDESQLVGYQSHEISRQTVPEDFRNKKIHRCWKLRAAAST